VLNIKVSFLVISQSSETVKFLYKGDGMIHWHHLSIYNDTKLMLFLLGVKKKVTIESCSRGVTKSMATCMAKLLRIIK